MTVVRKKKGAKKKASNKKSDPRNIPAMKKNIWKPGQSGNPKGRKPGKTIETIVLAMLDKEIGTGKDKMSRMEMLATVIIDDAISKRDPKIIKQLLDRLWPAGVEVNVRSDGGFTIVFDDQDRRA